MALRYGSKNGSALRYNPYSALALRYGSKIGWTSGSGEPTPTPAENFGFTLLEDDTYAIFAADASRIYNGLPDIVLPSTYNGKPVTQIADFGFIQGMNNPYSGVLRTVYIPKSITKIGQQAFLGQGNLTAVTIADDSNLNAIGGGAFGWCYSLASFKLPDGVKVIGGLTFAGCESLTEFEIGANSSLEVIEQSAITGTRLSTLYIPASVTTMDWGSIDSDIPITFYCEADSQPEGWDDEWYTGSHTVIWGYKRTDESYFTFTEQADGTYSVKAKDVSKLPSVVGIPWEYKGKAVTAIDVNAFRAATITKAVIPEGIVTIGEKAFDECRDITGISIPSSVTTIGSQAFGSCTSLTELVLPSGITEIPSYCFFNCAAFTGFTIPDTVTSIGQLAFAHCKFTSIVIPASVTTIGSQAFFNCANLTINCEATEQPSGWDANWNIDNRPVTWGYTG